MYRIILVTAVPDSTDANGIMIVGNKITEIRDFDKLANALAFAAMPLQLSVPAEVIAAQIYLIG